MPEDTATPATGAPAAADSTAAARWRWMREQTPALRNYIYLNCGWSGPLSVPVVEAVQRFMQLDLEGGPTTRHVLDERMAAGDRFREAVARMMGADAEEITIMGNTTEGLNVVLNGMTFNPGDAVVTTSVEHSSGLVPAYYLRERHGTDVRIVPCAADDSTGALLERFAGAIDDRTRVVVLSEISYSTGQTFPLRELVDMAHRHGAAVLVDGAQTAGQIPIDVRASGVDYYAIPSHKWLCGPDGLGALYVRRDLIAALEPAKVSGRAAAEYDHEGGFTAEREAITKFELTTVSGALLAGAAAAVDQYLQSGPQAVWDRVRELNRYAETRFDRIDGVTQCSPRSEANRSGLFAFSVAGEEPGRISAYLQLEGRMVCRAVRELGAVRLSLHVYNTEADVDAVAELVERALREGLPAELEAVTPWERRAAEQT